MKLLGIIIITVTIGTVAGVLDRAYASTKILNDNKCEIAYENYQYSKKLDNDAVLNDLLTGAASIGCDTKIW